MDDHLAGFFTSGIEMQDLILVPVLACAAAFVLVGISWFCDSSRKNRNPSGIDQTLYTIVRIYCMLDLGTMVGWGVLCASFKNELDFSFDIIGLKILTPFAATGIVFGSYNCYRSWRNSDLHTMAKLEDTSIAIAFVVFDLILVTVG